MLAVSLPFLIVCSLGVSAALLWLNLRGAGVLVAVGGMSVVCITIMSIQSVAFGSAGLTRQGAQSWGLFVLLPSAVLVAVSRLATVQARPWRLLFIGPLTFVVAVTAVMVTYNILFASARSQ